MWGRWKSWKPLCLTQRKGEGQQSSAWKAKVGIRGMGTHPTCPREVAPETPRQARYTPHRKQLCSFLQLLKSVFCWWSFGDQGQGAPKASPQQPSQKLKHLPLWCLRFTGSFPAQSSCACSLPFPELCENWPQEGRAGARQRSHAPIVTELQDSNTSRCPPGCR